MDKLTVFDHDGRLVIDSRDVAEMVGKEHKNLLQDIRGYIAHFAELKSQPSKNDSKYVQMAREMFERTHGNIDKAIRDFFIPHTYRDSTGRTLPCFLLTRKGCDMIANKMTGEKGVLFTAAYVTKFEEMERQLMQPQSIEDLIIMQAQAMKQLRGQVEEVAAATKTLTHRVENLDLIDIKGTPRQRLNAMIRKYAHQNKILFKQGWRDFVSAYNTAYNTNLNLRKTLREAALSRELTIPEFLEMEDEVEDAIRVADKMLNQRGVQSG